MKLKEKLALLTMIAVVGAIVFLLGYVMSTRCDRAANESLTEAKQTLAEQLETSPENLIVYWSGEYISDDQYRYRYRHRSVDKTATEATSNYEAYAQSVEPRFGDHVIQSSEVRELVRQTVNHRFNCERWEGVSFFGLLAVMIAPILAVASMIIAAFKAIVAV